jgi:RHS repeat-associated protein
MTGKTVNGTTTTFNYSVDNRLEKVEDQGGTTTASYYYDPFGRRLWKEVAGARTYFHYNDEGLAGEYNGAGNELRTYGYQPGSPWSTNPLFVQAGGEYYWYQNDHLGTPQKMISANGTVVWSARYDSFGLATVEVETVKNNLRFPGQYFDQETGLHYNWHRFYDPETGRYVSADPIGLEGGMNLYSYVGGDPVNWIDPEGLDWLNDYMNRPTSKEDKEMLRKKYEKLRPMWENTKKQDERYKQWVAENNARRAAKLKFTGCMLDCMMKKVPDIGAGVVLSWMFQAALVETGVGAVGVTAFNVVSSSGTTSDLLNAYNQCKNEECQCE